VAILAVGVAAAVILVLPSSGVAATVTIDFDPPGV
jgi:hypothetical protein